LAIEVSSTSINAASATVPAMIHGLTFGFHWAAAFCCSGVAGEALEAGSAVAVAKNSPGKDGMQSRARCLRGDLFMLKMQRRDVGMNLSAKLTAAAGLLGRQSQRGRE
jgi:hypothetical protein